MRSAAQGSSSCSATWASGDATPPWWSSPSRSGSPRSATSSHSPGCGCASTASSACRTSLCRSPRAASSSSSPCRRPSWPTGPGPSTPPGAAAGGCSSQRPASSRAWPCSSRSWHPPPSGPSISRSTTQAIRTSRRTCGSTSAPTQPAQIYLACSCWKYAHATTNRSIAVGLRLVAVGATITLGYSAIRIGAVLGAVFGFSVKGLDPYAWICGDVGATLTQIGYFLPTLARRIADGRNWASAHVAYRRLQHLWAALAEAHPGITLLRPDPQRGSILHARSARFPLLRRRTEIRHGQKLLRRYLDPAVRTESEARRAAEGLTGADLVAAVTADQIHAALTRFHTGSPVEAPVEYVDAHLPLPTAEDEQLHLERVAKLLHSAQPSDTLHRSPQHRIRSPSVILRRTVLATTTALAAETALSTSASARPRCRHEPAPYCPAAPCVRRRPAHRPARGQDHKS
ncbi:MAB_1171c family putative transporter [Streptomyces lasalocidi]